MPRMKTIPVQSGKPYTFQEQGWITRITLPPRGRFKGGHVAGVPLRTTGSMTRLVMVGQTIQLDFGEGTASVTLQVAE